MLKSLEEIKKVELVSGGIINGVDSPNLLSVDSTTPIQTPADKVGEEEDENTEVQDPPVKKVAAKPAEEEPVKKPEPPQEKVDEGQEKDKIQLRFDKLTKARRTAERERDFEKNKRLELEEELKKLKAKIPVTEKPLRGAFEDEDEFLEALADWKYEQKEAARREVEERAKKEESEKEVESEAFGELDAVMEKGRAKYKDFNDLVLTEELRLTVPMTEIIVESDVAEDIFYYLAKNPDVALEISELSKLKLVKAIAEIEGKVLKQDSKAEAAPSEPEKPVEKPVKKPTNAPEPIVPLKQDGLTEKDPSQMTPKEYRAWRERKKV